MGLLFIVRRFYKKPDGVFMNNKLRFQLASQNLANPATREEVLGELQAAILEGGDPLEAFAAFSGYEPHYMAKFMGCAEDLYATHVTLSGTAAFTPVRGEHLIKLCAALDLHPADFASVVMKPETACHPYVYEALRDVAFKSSSREDRMRAHAAMRLEKARHYTLLQTDPLTAQIVTQANEYARQTHRSVYPDLREDIANRPASDARAAFLEAIAIHGDKPCHDPIDRLDHYQMARADHVAGQVKMLENMRRHDRMNRQNLKVSAGILFGRAEVDHAFFVIEKALIFIREETNYSERGMTNYAYRALLNRCPLVRENIESLQRMQVMPPGPPESALMAFVKDYIQHDKSCAAARDHYRRTGILQADLKDLNEWFTYVNDPAGFHIQHLICNDAHAPQSVKVEPQYLIGSGSFQFKVS